ADFLNQYCEAASAPKTPLPISTLFKYTSKMRSLLQSVSINRVKYASSPFRNQVLSGHKKAFLAVCCEMVLPPRSFFPFSLFFKAFSIASLSKPLWLKNVWSSAQITASCKYQEISSMGTQSCLVS